MAGSLSEVASVPSPIEAPDPFLVSSTPPGFRYRDAAAAPASSVTCNSSLTLVALGFLVLVNSVPDWLPAESTDPAGPDYILDSFIGSRRRAFPCTNPIGCLPQKIVCIMSATAHASSERRASHPYESGRGKASATANPST